MFWCDKLTKKLEGPQVINDSKTPSGSAHVGALRGPLIHDAIYRSLLDRGVDVTYKFGCDDYDPVDEIPHGQDQHFEKYLGQPLCNVPPPPGSEASDMADHFISEFFGVFGELGIRPEFYRMRDIYRSGQFNEVIDAILQKADVVREVYYKVSGAERPETWYPFQTVCENCGRIGTTEVTGYDGKEVTYTCRPDLVTWATGCGHEGKMSPFDGQGKLPWKLEWCAKWKTFPVTIEGAGQDHSTKGGSRDVSAACLRRIFGEEPPLNCPYGFFLVGGAKMSSSKGIGATSREMVNFLPAEALRFLLMRGKPEQPVNFEPSEAHIVKLFNEMDRTRAKYGQGEKLPNDADRGYELADEDHKTPYWAPDFQLLMALVQMPHLDTMAELERRKGAPLTELDLKHTQSRIQAVEYWLEHFAGPDDLVVVQERLPERASELTAAQRGFLDMLAGLLADCEWEDGALQIAVFDAARLTPVPQKDAFKAIYRVILDRESGPKAGNLLSFMERDFVIGRFKECTYERADFLKETGLDPEAGEAWFSNQKDPVASGSGWTEAEAGIASVVFRVVTEKGKQHGVRVLFDEGEAAAQSWLDGFRERAGFAVEAPAG